jgi:hypothetical protein
VVGCLVFGCQGGPVGPGELAEEPAASAPAAQELAAGAVLDMGSEDSSRHVVDGFSLPEVAGSRRASWSEGDVATVAFQVQGGARSYQVTFLAEPYHELGDVAVGLLVNKQPVGDALVSRGWRSYQVIVPGDKMNRGRNELSFHFSKTGRPSDFSEASSDVRELALRFEQIQVQPLTSRLELAFGSRNTLALAALGEGWAREPGDRGTGTWSLGQRSVLTFGLDNSGESYRLSIDARAPRGIAERKVQLTLNGTPLGELTFGDTKTSQGLDIPAKRLAAENELVLEFGQLEPPSDVDPKSKDTRPLGLRVFQLDVTPKYRAQGDVASRQ